MQVNPSLEILSHSLQESKTLPSALTWSVSRYRSSPSDGHDWYQPQGLPMSRGDRRPAVASAAETLAVGLSPPVEGRGSCCLSRDEKPGMLLSCLWAGKESEHMLHAQEE